MGGLWSESTLSTRKEVKKEVASPRALETNGGEQAGLGAG